MEEMKKKRRGGRRREKGRKESDEELNSFPARGDSEALCPAAMIKKERKGERRAVNKRCSGMGVWEGEKRDGTTVAREAGLLY
jgi:hypothetical protein